MRLYNPHSCTPLVAASKKSPPRNFLPPPQRSARGIPCLKQGSPAKINDKNDSSPNHTSLTAEMSTPEKEIPVKTTEQLLFETLPALKDLDAILARATVLAGSDEDDASSLTTLSTKGSIEEYPSIFISQESSFTEEDWPEMTKPKTSKRARLPWPTDELEDESLTLQDYATIKANLRKVDSPLKQVVFPTQEEKWSRGNARHNFDDVVQDFKPFEEPTKTVTPISFDSLPQQGTKTAVNDAIRNMAKSVTPSTSNAAKKETKSPPPARVLFRLPDGPSILPLDRVQVPSPESDEKHIAKVPLQDDPTYAKYFRMLKMGLPLGAVKNAMRMDGHDPNILDGDPEQPASTKHEIPVQALQERVRHFRIHWDTRRNVPSNSVWALVRRDPDVTSMEVDDIEMKELFCCEKSQATTRIVASANMTRENTTIKVVDSKRANNGGITLARIRISYSEIARAVDNFDQDAMTPEQIRGIMQYTPTSEERSALRDYLGEPGHGSSDLCECEKFMVAMMGVKHANRKLSAILFMQSFSSCLEDLRRDARLMQRACEEIMNSSRFRKILGIILTLGNLINGAGPNGKEAAGAIKLDSLLKLNQAKAFDRQTTFLQFVVMNIRRNKASLIHFKDDMPSVFKVEKMQWSLVMMEMSRMEKGLDEVRKIALHYSKAQKGLVDPDDTVSVDNSSLPLASEVELLQTTAVGRFTLDACLRMAVLVNEIDKARDQFSALLQFFGEEKKSHGQPDEVFHTISEFGRNFDRALEDVIKQEKAKVREMRGVPIVRSATISFDDEEDPKTRIKSAEKTKPGTKGQKFRWRRRKA